MAAILDALYSLLQTILQPFQAIFDGVRHLVDNGVFWSDEEDTPPGTPDRMIPATPQQVDALPTTLHNTETEGGDDSKCCICRSVFEQGDNIMTLPCTHTFHANCVNPWLTTVNG
ncbi:E3 ubiquitin-protein ligase AIP2-like [Raphanus sativus]|nr:E3 ubiquitin-protein ligase AIP2-like [Raphanus sativus]